MKTQPWILDKWANFTRDYILSEVAAGTRLSNSDITSIIDIMTIEGANIVSFGEGTTKGWVVHKIEVIKTDDTVYNAMVTRWNNHAQDLINRGEGVVGKLIAEGDRIAPLNKNLMNLLDSKLDYANADTNKASKQILSDFMTSASATHPAFIEQMNIFISSNPEYAKYLLQMLQSQGIITREH